MEGTQGHLTLQLLFPQQWATTKEQDVACPRSCTELVVHRFLSMQTSKVGIDITVNSEVVIWGKDGTPVCRSCKVPGNHLDGGCMRLFGV